MKIHEIAKAAGVDKGEVADALGVPQEGKFWLKNVDDAEALTYIAETGATRDEDAEEKTYEVPQPERVWFWSKHRRYIIPAHDGCQDIKFADWGYSCAVGSPELAKMREMKDYLIAQGTYEVIPEPHSDPQKIADFRQAMEGTMRTGFGGEASREMRDGILNILPPFVAKGLDKIPKSNIREIPRIISQRVSLKVDAYGREL